MTVGVKFFWAFNDSGHLIGLLFSFVRARVGRVGRVTVSQTLRMGADRDHRPPPGFPFFSLTPLSHPPPPSPGEGLDTRVSDVCPSSPACGTWCVGAHEY